MSADSNDSVTPKKFPDFPGEHVLAHEGAGVDEERIRIIVAAARLAVTAVRRVTCWLSRRS